jgi:hypothetical protein
MVRHKEDEMRLLPIILLTLFVVGCKSEIPSGSESSPDVTNEFRVYNIKITLNAARELQGLGKDKAVAKLRGWAKSDENDLRAIILCRMLFKGQGNAALRRPYLGGAVFLGDTTYKDWPLEPITLFEGVPILIVQGYLLGGVAEPISAYLKYCLKEGVWVSEKYADKSPKQIAISVDRFIKETNWNRKLSDTEKAFLSSQAD